MSGAYCAWQAAVEAASAQRDLFEYDVGGTGNSASHSHDAGRGGTRRREPTFEPEPLPFWPVRARPEDGELLTSWIARLAEGLDVHPYELLPPRARVRASGHYTRPEPWHEEYFDNHRCTVEGCSAIVHHLAERTGVAPSRVSALALAAFLDPLTVQAAEYGGAGWVERQAGNRWFVNRWPWFPWQDPPWTRVTLDGHTGYAFCRRRVSGPVWSLTRGLSYCVACLTGDRVPYFRGVWQLPFMTCCPEHGEPLQVRCPACAAPIDLLRGWVRGRGRIGSRLTHCRHCGGDLRAGARARSGGAADARRLQERLSALAGHGWTSLPRGGVLEPVPVGWWFGVLAIVLWVVIDPQVAQRASKGEGPAAVRAAYAAAEGIPDAQPGEAWLVLSAMARARLLAAALAGLKSDAVARAVRDSGWTPGAVAHGARVWALGVPYVPGKTEWFTRFDDGNRFASGGGSEDQIELPLRPPPRHR